MSFLEKSESINVQINNLYHSIEEESVFENHLTLT